MSIAESRTYFKQHVTDVPDTALILGSGLSHLTMNTDVVLEYADVPGLQPSQVEGHDSYFAIGRIDETEVIVMDGRVHYYETGDMDTVVRPIRLLGTLGVENLIITNAAGGINQEFETGDLMVLDDHLNLMGDNPLVGDHNPAWGSRFPSMNEPYNSRFREITHRVAENIDRSVHNGVYAAMTGPSYETPAEIKMLSRLGADAVGMSTVPECIVANQMDMDVLGISSITNMAAGIAESHPSHDEVVDTAADIKPDFRELVRRVVAEL